MIDYIIKEICDLDINSETYLAKRNTLDKCLEKAKELQKRLTKTYKNIVLIGSSQYQDKFEEVSERLTNEGHTVCIPAFDSHPEFDDLGVCQYNKELIQKCDEVHLIWDGRSIGTIFDFGMVFYSGKPLVIEYIEEKTIKGVMEKYSKSEGDR